MPTNLYGPGDNYHSENSHVIPRLIRRFHGPNRAARNSDLGHGRPDASSSTSTIMADASCPDEDLFER